MYPVLDLLFSSVFQVLSVYPMMSFLLSFCVGLYMRALSLVVYKYLSTRIAAFQCASCGFSRTRDNCEMIVETSGLVSVAYMRLPMRLRYGLLVGGDPMSFVIFMSVDAGWITGLAFV